MLQVVNELWSASRESFAESLCISPCCRWKGKILFFVIKKDHDLLWSIMMCIILWSSMVMLPFLFLHPFSTYSVMDALKQPLSPSLVLHQLPCGKRYLDQLSQAANCCRKYESLILRMKRETWNCDCTDMHRHVCTYRHTHRWDRFYYLDCWCGT